MNPDGTGQIPITNNSVTDREPSWEITSTASGSNSIAIFRPSTGYWYFDYNLDGVVYKFFRYGGSPDRIIAGKWA
ncbi:MAG: hypothetical protein LUQ04_03005 [Methanoregula sp.]|nr:hypothetical protein [Methanoregula sp.]